MNSSVFNFDTIVDMLEEFKGLIIKFTDMLKGLIAGFKKVPAASLAEKEEELH